MNRSRMFLLAAVAFLVAIGVAAFTYQVLNNRLKPVDDTTQIVVAALNVSLGAKLTDADVRLAAWPKGSVPEGSFHNVSEVINRGVLYPIAPNEVILPNKLAQEGSGAGLMSTIPEGYRAVGVKVNDVIGVAGFVIPNAGARISLDLLNAFQSKGLEEGNPRLVSQGGSQIFLARPILPRRLQASIDYDFGGGGPPR